jgi:hypothetical protein
VSKNNELRTFVVGKGRSRKEVFTNLQVLPEDVRKEMEENPMLMGHIDFTALESTPFKKDRTAATRKDWKTHRMPKRRTTISVDKSFSAEEMERIKLGLIPVLMEHRWFIYYKEDKLYWHRSWTGFCIYIVEFEQDGDRFVISQVEVNRDRRQYESEDDARDAETLLWLIDELLLYQIPEIGRLTAKQKETLVRLAQNDLRVGKDVHWRTAKSLFKKHLVEAMWGPGGEDLRWCKATIRLSDEGADYLGETLLRRIREGWKDEKYSTS